MSFYLAFLYDFAHECVMDCREKEIIKFWNDDEGQKIHDDIDYCLVAQHKKHIDKFDTQDDNHLAKANREGREPWRELPRMIQCILLQLEALTQFVREWHMKNDSAEKPAIDDPNICVSLIVYSILELTICISAKQPD